MLRIENSHEWSPSRLLAVLPSVRACIQRYVAEFPDELSENCLLGDTIVGNKQLWVVYDEADPKTAVLAVFTEWKKYDATGAEFIEIVGIGGERIREALPLIAEIEQWAEEQGAESALVIGRFGWIPMLKERGYQKKAVILKKTLGVDNHGHG